MPYVAQSLSNRGYAIPYAFQGVPPILTVVVHVDARRRLHHPRRDAAYMLVRPFVVNHRMQAIRDLYIIVSNPLAVE